MLIIGIGMIVLPLLWDGKINIVSSVFGGTGLFFALRNLRLYRNKKELQKKWLKLHLGNMMGGYIASVTAFVVVNDFFPSIYGWFVPGIIGGIFIIYWLKKLDKRQFQKLQNPKIY